MTSAPSQGARLSVSCTLTIPHRGCSLSKAAMCRKSGKRNLLRVQRQGRTSEHKTSSRLLSMRHQYHTPRPKSLENIAQSNAPEIEPSPTSATTDHNAHPGLPAVTAAALGTLQAEARPPETLKVRDCRDKHEAHCLLWSAAPPVAELSNQ